MNNNKSKAIALNSLYSGTAQIIHILLNLIVRRTFIQTLGNELLGLNSLFSNVISVLSLSDLGVSSAVVVFLYKPLADKENLKIRQYLNFLKKFCRIIGFLILVIGLLISPFIKIFVVGDISNSVIVKSFVLYVIASSLTYFYGYKKVLIEADMKSYLVSFTTIFYKLLLNLLYLIVLKIFNNYYLFLTANIIANSIDWFVINRIFEKYYPSLVNLRQEKLDKRDRDCIIKKIRSILFHKVGDFFITGADNVIISSTISTSMVAYFSNYQLITNMLHAIVGSISYDSIAAFGNILSKDKKMVYRSFSKLMLIQQYIYSITCIGFLIVSCDFIYLVFGVTYKFDFLTITLMGIIYYIQGYSNSLKALRTALGAFEMDKYVGVICAFVNIIISILCVKKIGVSGVLIGTLFVYFVQYICVLPSLVFKLIDMPVINYYIRLFFCSLLTFGAYFIAKKIIMYLCLGVDWCSFVIKVVICVIIALLINYLAFNHTEEQNDLNNLSIRYIKKIFSFIF